MKNKTLVIVVGAVVLALISVTLLAFAGLWIGGAWLRAQAGSGAPGEIIAGLMGGDWNRDGRPFNRGYGPGMMGSTGDWEDMPCGSAQGTPCGEGWQRGGMIGPDMMGRTWEWKGMPFGSTDEMPCGSTLGMPCAQGYVNPDDQSNLSLEEAKAAVEAYVSRLGYTGLHVTEVMEFEQNFYAIVAEDETGIGAMELLVDKSDGSVGLEPGPNMMWNAKYGMHRGGRMGMMGGYATDEMTLSPGDAEQVAQRWLDANLSGRTAGEADPFYGYYTLHFLNDGQIEGMLSVHGSSGDVWYHSWHGAFVDMIGDHE